MAARWPDPDSPVGAADAAQVAGVAVPGLAAAGGPDEVGAGRPARGYGIAFWLSTAWLAVVALSAILAPLLPIPSPDAVDPFHRLKRLGASGHLLGSDTLGRDLLSRIVYGARVSLIVGVVSVVIGLAVGGTIGMIAGYLRNSSERVIMWAVDVLLSFPALVLVISIVAYVGRSLATISLVLGFLAIPIYARLARAYTLAIGEREFIMAARAIGVPGRRIVMREIVPNVLPAVLSYALIAMGVVIVVEGSLSFLGLSVSAPTPSWGGLIADGQTFLSQDPGLVLIPSAVLCLTVLALNMAGDTLRRRHELGVRSSP